jgi:hypothetical protein
MKPNPKPNRVSSKEAVSAMAYEHFSFEIFAGEHASGVISLSPRAYFNICHLSLTTSRVYLSCASNGSLFFTLLDLFRCSCVLIHFRAANLAPANALVLFAVGASLSHN